MKRLLLALALALLPAVLAASVSSAPAKVKTTAPGYNFYIGVYITEKNVILTRSVGRRGWRAHFIVHNKGKVRHRFDVGGLVTPWIKPGRKVRLGAQLDVRGQYAYKVDNKVRGYFTVI